MAPQAVVAALLASSLSFLGTSPAITNSRCTSPSMRAAVSDPLQILGLKEGASDGEIKAAFRKSALKYHPDRHADRDRENAAQKFKEIREAYEQLQGKSGRAAAPPSPPPPPPRGPWRAPPGYGAESPAPPSRPPAWEVQPNDGIASYRASSNYRRPAHAYAYHHQPRGPWRTAAQPDVSAGSWWSAPNNQQGFHPPPPSTPWQTTQTTQQYGSHPGPWSTPPTNPGPSQQFRHHRTHWQNPVRNTQPQARPGTWGQRQPENPTAGFRHPRGPWQRPRQTAWQAHRPEFRPPTPPRKSRTPRWGQHEWGHPGNNDNAQSSASQWYRTTAYEDSPRQPPPSVTRQAGNSPGFVGFMSDTPPLERTVTIDGREYVEHRP